MWAYRIVAREALRIAKRHAPKPLVPEARHEPDLDSRIDLFRALGKLPPGLRSAIVLAYYADLNSREIGYALGVPSATVRFRLAQARRRLQALLDERNIQRNYVQEVLL